MAEITERIEEEYDASQIQVLEGLESGPPRLPVFIIWFTRLWTTLLMKRLPGIVIISP